MIVNPIVKIIEVSLEKGLTMNEHFYYALKYFCNQKLLRHTVGFSEEDWSTTDYVCEYYIDHWKCEHDLYVQKFTYHKGCIANKIEVCDNYHTQKLYEWLVKRRGD